MGTNKMQRIKQNNCFWRNCQERKLRLRIIEKQQERQTKRITLKKGIRKKKGKVTIVEQKKLRIEEDIMVRKKELKMKVHGTPENKKRKKQKEKEG
jgi:hypothetical protein